ncbi:MAG: DNA ligase D [Actinobacteria bacterium]|nr:MAG: DNA ligase D [Actinomycetota bacterium]
MDPRPDPRRAWGTPSDGPRPQAWPAAPGRPPGPTTGAISRHGAGPARRVPRQAGLRHDRRAGGRGRPGGRDGPRAGGVRPVRRPGAPRHPPALGPAARARRRARLVGGPQRHSGRPQAQPPGGAHRGPPAGVPRVPRRDPQGPVRRGDDDDLGPRDVRGREVARRRDHPDVPRRAPAGPLRPHPDRQGRERQGLAHPPHGPARRSRRRVPRTSEGWAFEVKWDGIRAIAYSRPGTLRLETRNLREVTAGYPELRKLNRALSSHRAILDGEIVAFDEQGHPSFARMQQRMHLTSESLIRRRAREVPVVYVIFDVLWLDGHSLMDRPLRERRELLESLGLNGPNWQTPAQLHGDGKELLAATAAAGLEGLIVKRLDSGYEPGRRTGAWVKVKNVKRDEFVIVGWEPGEGRREHRIGSLLIARHDPETGELVYAGEVGTGFTDQTLDDLARRLAPLRIDHSPLSDETRRPPRTACWVEPLLLAEIEFTDMTKDGMLRHPSFKGLRADKQPPIEVVAELPKDGREIVVEGREIKVSNWSKVLWPKTGFTKGDLVSYYARIAPVLLPHLEDRPLTLKRYPNGVEGQHFYEKNCPRHRPDWVQTATVTMSRKKIDFCLARDTATLVWLANLADIELHTSLSRVPEIGRPTMMVFDLDPGPPADLVQCCEVALVLRGLFEGVGLQSLAKTSGSKGLQVYVPLNVPDATYAQTKGFSRQVAELLETQLPDLVVSRMTKSLRGGKVLVDWSQNDEKKTTVNVYSVRARERPTVSTPVSWDEVRACLDAGDASLLSFDTEQVLGRADELGDLFAPALRVQQRLPV